MSDGDSHFERAMRVTALVADLIARRDAGESIDPRRLIDAHPDLTPQLECALRRCGVMSSADSVIDCPDPIEDDSTTSPRYVGPDTHTSPTADSKSGNPLPPPGSIPGYTVAGEISSGGQGIVYRAIQNGTNRTVAIKVMRDGVYASREARTRFEREIETVARLNHPNIVTIHHSGETTDGRQFYVMEFVTGTRFDEFVHSERLSVHEVLFLFTRVCDAVQCAHSSGIIHRDLKPGNILVSTPGNSSRDSYNAAGDYSDSHAIPMPRATPMILDFGLAKWVAQPFDADITGSNVLVGTLPYMSPEQAAGESFDERTDVYSLGIILYRVLTGSFPYDVYGPLQEALANIASTPPIPPSRNWSAASGVVSRIAGTRGESRCPIDRDVETIILKAIEKERGARYQSVGALGADIADYLAGRPIRARRGAFYRIRSRARHFTLRQPAVAHALAIVLATLAGQAFINRAPVKAYGLDHALHTQAHVLRRSLIASDWSSGVVVVAINDDTFARIPSLASAAGLADVTQGNVQSWRRLHGEFMRRIAPARPRVVAWDINFAPSPVPTYDADFVAGVNALRDVGTPVIVALRYIGHDLRPVLSSAISAAANERAWLYSRTKSDVISGPFVISFEPGVGFIPGLSLAAWAASRHRGFTPMYVWYPGKYSVLDIRFFRDVPEGNTTRREWEVPEMMLVPDVALDWRLGALEGFKCDDRIAASVWTMLPKRSVLDQNTIAYHDAFNANSDDIGRMFADKILVLGDVRIATVPHGSKPDRHKTQCIDGVREEPGCYVHAAAICDMLNGIAARLPSAILEPAINLLAALSGTLVLLRSAQRRLRDRIGLLLLLATLWAVSAFAIFVAIRVAFSVTAAYVSLSVALMGSFAVIKSTTYARKRTQAPPALESRTAGSDRKG